MKIVLSKSGVPIRLTPERMDHVSRRHPEMAGQEQRILETVAEPDLIQEGEADARIALRDYPRTPLTEKFCAVIYREVSDREGFVITAYFCSTYASTRRVIWKR